MTKKTYIGLRIETVLVTCPSELLAASGSAANSLNLQNITVEDFDTNGPFEVYFGTAEL